MLSACLGAKIFSYMLYFLALTSEALLEFLLDRILSNQIRAELDAILDHCRSVPTMSCES